MNDSALRRLAFWLLRQTLRITPSNARDWGNAMLSELGQVESSRAAFRWAIGSSLTLVRMSLREVVVQRMALVPGAVSVLVLLSLLLVPGFRQGLNASITSWQVVLLGSHNTRDVWERQLRDLAIEAEERKDARTFAFVATRLGESIASASAANRAVELDPSLTWVYYVAAVRNVRTIPYLQELQAWSKKLKEWDPENAAPLLLEAESVAFKPEIPGFFRRGNPDWRNAIERAARAPRFDDYLRQQIDSDRDVVQRYGIWDPLLFIQGFPDRRIFNDYEHEIVVGPLRKPRYGDGPLFRYLQPLQQGWGWPGISVRIVQIATLLIPGSIGMVIIGVMWQRRTPALGITGGMILFVASTTLYVAYLPHAQDFHRLIVDGNLSLLESVKAFHTYGFPTVRVAKPFLMRSVQIAAIALVSASWIGHMVFLRGARNS
jgi:hypothetical protein